MQGHYESLYTTIELSSIVGLYDIKDFESLFETITTDKIGFEESKSAEKAYETIKSESEKK